MAERDDNPFRQTEERNPFRDATAPAFQPPPEHSVAETVADVGEHGVRGINKGLVGLLTAPYRAIDWVGEKITGGDFLPNAEDMALYKPFLKQTEAKTDLGRYAAAAGEAVGASAIPSGALISQAPRLAALTPTTAMRGVAQQVGETIARNPSAALAADAVTAAASGVGTQAAEDSGFGPTGQVVGGMIGGFTPAAVSMPFAAARRSLNQARATRDPHAQVMAKLPEDMSLDDLAHSVATGHSRIDPGNTYAQRTLDILGEEMVRAGGNRQQALPATLARIVAEDGVTPATARTRLRSVVQTQLDNELMLGEYPAVAGSNELTRRRDPGVLMRELDTADAMPNREAASAHRAANDPGRIDDAGTHWLLDTVANAGDPRASSTVRNAIDRRLDNLHNQARQRIQSWAPHGANTDDIEGALGRMRQMARAAYRRVYDAVGGTAVDYNMLHGLLGRTVDRHMRRLGGLGGDHAEELRKAINGLYISRPAGVVAREALPDLEDQVAQLRAAVREGRRQGMPKAQLDDMARDAEMATEQLRLTRRDATPPTQQYLLPTLEQLQVMRSGIRRQMDDPTRPDLAVVLGPLYRDITRLMERSSPAWRIANRQWADLQLDIVARDLGESISFQAGPRFREQLREFRQLAPEAQDFVRVEVAQKFVDKLANMGDSENLAKLFKTRHMRDLVRTMFGENAAVDMLRLAREQNVAAKSKGMMGGSPTQPRQARQQELNADLELAAAAEIPTGVGGWLNAIKRYTIDRAKMKRARDVAGIITTPVRDTMATAEHLERMRRAQELAARYRIPEARQPGLAGYTGAVLPPLTE